MKSLDVLRSLNPEATAVVEGWMYGALDDVAALDDDIAALRNDLSLLAGSLAEVNLACADLSELRLALKELVGLRPTIHFLGSRDDQHSASAGILNAVPEHDG